MFYDFATLKFMRQLPASVVGTRILSLIVPFLCLPIILANVGTRTLGEFYLLFSINSIFGFLDLGIPNSISKLLALAQGKSSEKIEQGQIIRHSIYRIGIVGIFTVVILYASTSIFPFGNLFNLNTKDFEIFRLSLVVSIFSLFLKFIGNVGMKVLAFQDQYSKSQILDSLSTALGYLTAALISFFRTDLFTITIALITVPSLIVLLFNKNVLVTLKSEKRISILRKENNLLKFNKLNLLFIYLQLTTILMMQVDSLIVGSILSPIQVSTLNLSWKFFSIPYLITVSVYGFIWTEASKVNTLVNAIDFYNQVLANSKKLFIMSLIFALFIVLFGQQVILLWADEVSPTKLFCLASGVWLCMSSVAYPINMMLNGMNFSSYLIKMATINVLVNLVGSICLTMYLRDPAGVLLGSALGQIFGFFIPFYFFFIKDGNFRKRLKKVSRPTISGL